MFSSCQLAIKVQRAIGTSNRVKTDLSFQQPICFESLCHYYRQLISIKTGPHDILKNQVSMRAFRVKDKAAALTQDIYIVCILLNSIQIENQDLFFENTYR